MDLGEPCRVDTYDCKARDGELYCVLPEGHAGGHRYPMKYNFQRPVGKLWFERPVGKSHA